MEIKILGMFLLARGIASTADGSIIEPMREYTVVLPEELDQSKYSEVEENCRACMGPCGMCEDVNNQPQ